MGDFNNKPSDLSSRNCLSHKSIEIPEYNESETSKFSESNSFYKPMRDVSNRLSFSEALNSLNNSRNQNRDYPFESLSNYELNERINLLPNEAYDNNNNFSNSVTNSENLEPVFRPERYNNLQQQVPYVLTIMPQYGINQNLNKSQNSGAGNYYKKFPLTSEPAIYWRQRSKYYRPTYAQRNIDYSWYKTKMHGPKGNFKPIYSTDTDKKRSYGPVGAELSGLRRGLPLRNFPGQVNMVRIFPDKRIAAYNNQERSTNYYLTQKHSEMFTNYFNSNFNINGEDNMCVESKYGSSSPQNEKCEKKNKSTLVTTSVHLGGLLTIPRGIDNSLDNSSHSSSEKSNNNNNNNNKLTNNFKLFKESTIQGCYEIQKLITQYNIKSSNISIDNFCKNVCKQINNSKNIMQMEPIMREMILGYLYLSSSWISLASVLAMPREQNTSLDHCLDSLNKEFSHWQRKSKAMLEQIIIALKQIPLEHEKYIAGIYKSDSSSGSSSSSTNSTLLSDDSFTSDTESLAKDTYKNGYWKNDMNLFEDFTKFPINKKFTDTPKNIMTRDSDSNNNNNNFRNRFELNWNKNYYPNGETKLSNTTFKQELNDTNKYNENNNIGTKKISLLDCPTFSNEATSKPNINSLFNNGNGKKNYSSNRPPVKNKCNSSLRWNGGK